MREIKFRAWDIENKQWWRDGEGFAISWDATEIIDDNGVDFTTKGRVELMQYTGLKDKNGKEIYEGDIISAIDFEKTNYKIKFEDGCFIFTNGLRGHQLDYSTIQNLQAEVIGNIYENSELL